MSEWERKRERENESNDGRAKARGKKIFQSLTSFSSKRQTEKRKRFFFGFRRNNLGPECWRRRLLRLETDFYLSHRKTNFEPRPEKIGSDRSDRVDKDEKRPNFFPPEVSAGDWISILLPKNLSNRFLLLFHLEEVRKTRVTFSFFFFFYSGFSSESHLFTLVMDRDSNWKRILKEVPLMLQAITIALNGSHHSDSRSNLKDRHHKHSRELVL